MRPVHHRSRRPDGFFVPLLLAALVGLSPLGAGCSSTGQSAAMPEADAMGDERSTPYPVPTFSALPKQPGVPESAELMKVQVIYRSEIGVPISARQPLQVRMVKSIIRLPLVAGPTRTYDDGPTPGTRIYIDEAIYEMPRDEYARLTNTPPLNVTLAIHDGRRYWPYAYHAGVLDARRPLQRPHYSE